VTATEFACPLLLPLGLAARLAALPILAMALVIQFVIGFADPAFHLTEHYYWMFVLAVIVTKAPGRFSPDHLLARRLAYSKRLGPEVSR
jgi:putative oxidoreductase